MIIQLKVLLVLVMMALMIHGKHDETGDCHVSPGAFRKKEPVKANVGDNITLPCIPTFKFNKDDDSFEWLKNGKQITLIKEKHVNKIHKNYTNRINQTALLEELDNGKASLNLSNVKLSDNGTFCCCINNGTLLCINVTLVVTSAGKAMQKNNDTSGNSTNCPDWVIPVCGVLLPVFAVSTCISTVCAIYKCCKCRKCCKKKKERRNEVRGRPRSQNRQQENPEALLLEVRTDNNQRPNRRRVRQRRKVSTL